jgi:hypothetical protein
VTSSGQRWSFDRTGHAIVTDAFGRITWFERVTAWSPTVAELTGYAGEYRSDEAEATFTAAVAGDRLVLRQRPERVLPLTPAYEDAFTGSLGTVRFVRSANGTIEGLVIAQDRVWAMRFQRTR